MGTRGLIYLTIRGEKRSCYVHLDSFPQRLGAALAQFILDLDTASRLRMAAMLEKIIWVPYESYPFEAPPLELTLLYNDHCRDERPRSPWQSWDDTIRLFSTGVNVLPAILNGEITHMVDSGDDLFAQYTYHLDFRASTFGHGGKEWRFKDLEKGFWRTATEAWTLMEEESALRNHLCVGWSLVEDPDLQDIQRRRIEAKNRADALEFEVESSDEEN